MKLTESQKNLMGMSYKERREYIEKGFTEYSASDFEELVELEKLVDEQENNCYESNMHQYEEFCIYNGEDSTLADSIVESLQIGDSYFGYDEIGYLHIMTHSEWESAIYANVCHVSRAILDGELDTLALPCWVDEALGIWESEDDGEFEEDCED